MNRIPTTTFALAALAFAIGLLGAGRTEAATERAALQVGFINLAQVQEKALPVRQKIDAATKHIDELNAQAEVKTQKLTDLRKQAKNASLLSKEAQARIASETETVQEEVDKLTYEIQREISKVEDKTISTALDLIVNAIDTVAKRNGYALIVKSETIVYGDPSCDITNAVIEYLNANAQTAEPSAAAKSPSAEPAAPRPKGN